MVLDKFQVRTTGPVDPVTRQPVKVSFFPPPLEHSLNVILLLGSQTGGRNPVWRNGTGRFNCARYIFLASRQIDELFRLLDGVGLSNLWESYLAWLR